MLAKQITSNTKKLYNSATVNTAIKQRGALSIPDLFPFLITSSSYVPMSTFCFDEIVDVFRWPNLVNSGKPYSEGGLLGCNSFEASLLAHRMKLTSTKNGLMMSEKWLREKARSLYDRSYR